jgi:hypothetical protein
MNTTASFDIAKRPPMACIGPERFLPIVMPGDHLSAIGNRSFQYRDPEIGGGALTFIADQHVAGKKIVNF